MKTMIKKELHSYFTTMTGYVFISFLVLVTAVFFTAVCLFSASPEYSSVLSASTIVLLIVMPMLTMGMFAEEAKLKTDYLLFTSPLRTWQIVLGKFVAAVALFAIAVAVTVIFPLCASAFGKLPTPQIVGTYMGFLLLGIAFISVGLFISTLTHNPMVAAVGAFGALFLFYIMPALISALPRDKAAALVVVAAFLLFLAYHLYEASKSLWPALVLLALGAGVCGALFVLKPDYFEGLLVKIFSWFSIMTRFENFFKGVLNGADLVYYISFSAAFVLGAIYVLENKSRKGGR